MILARKRVEQAPTMDANAKGDDIPLANKGFGPIQLPFVNAQKGYYIHMIIIECMYCGKEFVGNGQA